MPIVCIKGIEFSYEIEGDGPETIVLMNGLADDLSAWSAQVPEFVAAGYRVLRFENRGVVAPGWLPRACTTASLAKDAKALLDKLKITDIHLVGASMGGMIAQEYALAFPEDLRSLTLCCTYAAPGPYCRRVFRLWQDIAREMGVAAVMRAVTLLAFSQDIFHQRETMLLGLEATIASGQPVDAYLGHLRAIQSHDARRRLPSLRVPSLVIAGAEDALVPVHLAKELHALIPRAKLTVLHGGHMLLWEHSDAFNRRVLAFVGAHGAAPLRHALVAGAC